jgi:hypothetical protein
MELVGAQEGGLQDTQAEASGQADLLPVLQPKQGSEDVKIAQQHPQFLAYESLEDLVDYCPHLMGSCQKVAYLIRQEADFFAVFLELIDQLEIFVQTVQMTKRILKAYKINELAILEADMVSILRDLQFAVQAKNEGFIADLLENQMTKNMEAWKEKGLPLMLRLQNC